MVDFGSQILPIPVAQKIWFQISWKERFRLEQVCRSWQWPAMSYRDVKEFSVALKPPYEIYPFLQWFPHFIDRVGPHLESLALPPYQLTSEERSQIGAPPHLEGLSVAVAAEFFYEIVPLLRTNCSKLHKLDTIFYQRMIPHVPLPDSITSIRLVDSGKPVWNLQTTINSLRNLEVLDLERCAILDIDDIRLNLPRLRAMSVDVKGRCIDTAYICENSCNLEVVWVKADWHSNANLSAILSLRQLRSLDICDAENLKDTSLWSNRLLSQLCQACPMLEDLCLAFCDSNLEDFSPLCSLPKLSSLNVNRCGNFYLPICLRLLNRGLRRLSIVSTGIFLPEELSQIVGFKSLKSLMYGRDLLDLMGKDHLLVLKGAFTLELVCCSFNGASKDFREGLGELLIFRRDLIRQGVKLAEMKLITTQIKFDAVIPGLSELADEAMVNVAVERDMQLCSGCRELLDQKMELFLK